MGADGEYFGAAAHQQNLLISDVAQQLVVDEIARTDTLGQIRAARRFLLFGHGRVPPLPRSPRNRRIKNRWIAAEKVPAPRWEKYQITAIVARKVTSPPRYPFYWASSLTQLTYIELCGLFSRIPL
jgi:hypothetical protein